MTPVLRALGRFQFRAAALFALAAVTCPGKLAAQDSLSVADTSSQTCYCDPGVPNMQRPKGLSIAYETMYEYGLNAEDNQGNRYSEEVGRKHMLEAKLKFPVLLKPGWKVAMKLAYEQERFRFESNKANLESPVFNFLENRTLQTYTTGLYLSKPTQGERYYLTRANFDFSGDFELDKLTQTTYMQATISSLVGWKKSEDLSWGVGLAYSNSFGRHTVLPAVMYNHNVSSDLGLEVMLPYKAEMRYNLNRKTILYAGLEGSSQSYRVRIDEPGFSEHGLMEFSNLNISGQVEVQREIHDFLWVGFTTGVRKTFSQSLAASPKGEDVVSLPQRLGGFFRFEVFLVPPRSMANR